MEQRWPKNYQEQAGEFLTQAEAIFNQPEHIPLKCELYSNLLVNAAKNCLETITSSNKKSVKLS